MADGGIEWLFELNAKLDQVNKMVRELGKLEAATLKTDEALKKTEKRVGIFRKSINVAGRAFASFGRSTLSHLTALATFGGLSRLASGITNVAGSALQAAGEAERTRRSFRLLLGEAPGDEMVGFLDRLATHTEFTDGALKGFATELLRAGFAGEQFERAMAATLDLASLAPEKMQGAAQALQLISQVKLRGRIEDGQIARAGLSSKNIFGSLQEQLGVGLKDVKQRLAEGKVDTTLLIETLYSEVAAKTGKPLGGAGVEMSKTFLAQVDKFKDIIPNLFEDLETSGGLQKITESIARFAAALSPDQPAGQKIISGLEGMIERFGRFTASIDFDKLSSRIILTIDIIAGAVSFTAKLVNEVFNVIEGLTGFGAELGGVIADIVDGGKRFFQAAFDMGAMLWKGFTQGLKAFAQGAIDAVGDMGKAVVGKLKGVLGISSPSRVFAELGVQTSVGFSLGIEDAIPDVEGAMARVFDPAMLVSPIPPVIPSAPDLLGIPPIDIPSIDSLAAGAMAGLPVAPLTLGAGMGGGTHMEAHITVNIGGSFGGADAEQRVGEAAGFAIRQALEQILSQMAGEGGAA